MQRMPGGAQWRDFGRWAALALGCGMAFWSTSASSEPASPRTNEACRSAAELAQSRWEAGHLREARALFLGCTSRACGARAANCRSALQLLEQDIPSVVPVVTDAGGAPFPDVEVDMDGKPLISHLDGRGLPVDPGLHEFSFRTAQGVFHTESILVVEGQRNRIIAAQWLGPIQHGPAIPGPDELPPGVQPSSPADTTPDRPPSAVLLVGKEQRAPSEPPPNKRSPVWTYAIGGVGAALIGTSLLLVNWGSKDNDRLDQCAPNCKRSSVEHVRHLYIASDIAMGGGIAALGVATWLFVSDLTREQPPRATAYTLDVNALDVGAVATLRGHF